MYEKLTIGLIKTGILVAAMTALFLVVGFLIGGMAGILVALGLSVGLNAYAYWNSDQMALKWHNARVVTRASAPDLFKMVETLSNRANISAPGIYFIDSEQPNAFATGRTPDKAAIAITTGLIDMLSEDELAGVVSHEIAHIKNSDTLVMTITAMLAGAISMLAQYGIYFRGQGGPAGIAGRIIAILMAPLAATLIQLLVSRTREYEADRLGAELCRNPLWLAAALEKISKASDQIPMPSAEKHPASAHLFVVNPLTGGGMDDLFSTHPKAENRIAALNRFAEEMERYQNLASARSWAAPKSRVQY